MQLLGTSTAVPNDPGIRLRLQTPAIPLAEHRLAAKQELMKAVAAELLKQVGETDLKDHSKPDEQSTDHGAREGIAA
jgi:hypothetical protein